MKGSKKRFPLIFPFGSYNSLINLPRTLEAGDFIYHKLIASTLTYSTFSGKEGRLLEMEGTECMCLYPIIESLCNEYAGMLIDYFAKPPYDKPEARYKLYFDIHKELLQKKRTYAYLFFRLREFFAKALMMYKEGMSIEDMMQDREKKPFLSTLFLHFHFDSSFHKKILSKYLDAVPATTIGYTGTSRITMYEKYGYKFYHILFCGVPVFQWIFTTQFGIGAGTSPTYRATGEPEYYPRYEQMMNVPDKVGGKMIDTVVFFVNIPIHITFK